MLLRVLEQVAQDADGVGERSTVRRVEPLQVRVDDRAAVGADLGQRRDALLG